MYVCIIVHCYSTLRPFRLCVLRLRELEFLIFYLDAASPSSSVPQEPIAEAKKKVKSFEEFRRSKGKQWKSLVSKTSEKKGKNDKVQIIIALFEWNLKGKRIINCFKCGFVC